MSYYIIKSLDIFIFPIHTKNEAMFRRLTDFSYKRTDKEALGFYLAYLLVIIIVSAILTSLFGGADTFYPNTRIRIGTSVAIACSLLLSFFVLSHKKLNDSFGFILLSLLSGLIATFGGGLLGLIIPAVLTTKDKKKK
jgi:RsiW-degrading membrane proteinase PrsW (M82 family)